jgi:hypothetical protein
MTEKKGVGGDGLRGHDKQQEGLRDVSAGKTNDLPEGLKRERKDPLSASTGRSSDSGTTSKQK